MLPELASLLLSTGPASDIIAQAANPDTVNAFRRLAAGLAIGLGGIGPGIGIGIAVMGAMQAIGRNPDAAGDIRGTMILGAGLAEAVAIYAFVVALVLLFVG
jgi:F-type H+-transporting ATPase subunit c